MWKATINRFEIVCSIAGAIILYKKKKRKNVFYMTVGGKKSQTEAIGFTLVKNSCHQCYKCYNIVVCILYITDQPNLTSIEDTLMFLPHTYSDLYLDICQCHPVGRLLMNGWCKLILNSQVLSIYHIHHWRLSLFLCHLGVKTVRLPQAIICVGISRPHHHSQLWDSYQ